MVIIGLGGTGRGVQSSRAIPRPLPRKISAWQPRRIFVNGRGGESNSIHMEISGTDAVSGLSYNDLSVRSRAMHKTQGFDNFRGFGGGNGAHTESFSLLDGEPATHDIMDGIDTTWSRVPGGAEIGRLADSIIAAFNPQDMAASVPDLLKLRSLVAALPNKDSVVTEKSAQLDHILQSCLGLDIETTIAHSEVVPGETMKLHHTVTLHASVPVRWISVQYPDIQHKTRTAVALKAGEPASHDASETLPANTPLTQPYWLREDRTPGMFVVQDASLIGRPENSPVFPVEEFLKSAAKRSYCPMNRWRFRPLRTAMKFAKRWM